MATVISGAAEPTRGAGLWPPHLAKGLMLAALLIHAAVWGLEAPFGRLPSVGVAIAGAGAGWVLWAWWCLRRAGTPVLPTAEPRVLVDDGPYRFGRHPMYLGLAFIITGCGIALGSPLLAPAAVAFLLIVDRVHIPFEEARLKRRFGGWYSDYAADVRRWI
ncbi:isoprenylcysteine carboxylmethyltransferase family protein [Aquincola sp. S2]|uniref:Isoprenylcysteine carboxylmethyltransferase family protein n=1 Tax=Pseudaquabacterium terrae TaxID=2732868 RepID=A0ABX2EHC3_9BURK|nr:isoprenylcysteine carboxylmethyltransferase family protein [Aquabacterium terrae]NRF68027.1 isoprenylcysteine carboxylmethyltransferase family protein [Aquabacterium terrae]